MSKRRHKSRRDNTTENRRRQMRQQRQTQQQAQQPQYNGPFGINPAQLLSMFGNIDMNQINNMLQNINRDGIDFNNFNLSNSSSLNANTNAPFLLKGNCNSLASSSIILFPCKFNLAFKVPFFHYIHRGLYHYLLLIFLLIHLHFYL